MSHIHVCPLSQVAAVVRSTQPRWAISLLTPTFVPPDFSDIAPTRRLHLAVSDVIEPTLDHVLAAREHVGALLGFLTRWDRSAPLLIHCYAGVSRSTAAAFIALCHFDGRVSEHEHARRLRVASPTATPNPHLVALADTVLGRGGRMSAAIASIGRGAECFEGAPFALPVFRFPGKAGPVLDGPHLQPA